MTVFTTRRRIASAESLGGGAQMRAAAMRRRIASAESLGGESSLGGEVEL